ncbi:hypothetical protein F5J12DRAFT_845228 [Pisolithus orientalis]|uniref:uncharacterized protein n=1 Tax=Pisolithus orientalis TaxID=936130 RepID=UPI0022258190|nr:uncharacterized protein F5J12DRAFT_845228 [Pisolithus orientalis]KAI6000312.1 hypothetical protein F5J12DRAFT_845228 [Pisolithus orientalis]
MLCYKLNTIPSSLYRSCFVFVIVSSIRSLRDTVFYDFVLVFVLVMTPLLSRIRNPL